jgi:PAS domain S-box-containing protein
MQRAAPEAPDLHPQAPRRPGGLLGFIAGSLGVLALLAALAGAILHTVVEQRTADLHAALRARLEAEAGGRAQVLATWLERTARLGQRLTRSDLVRLFVGEMAATLPDRPPARWLADQVPYMTQLMGDFVAQHGLLGATLIGRDGRIFLASRDAPLPERRSWAERIERLQSASDQIVTPIREIGPGRDGRAGRPGLGLDLLLPVPGPQVSEEGALPGFPAVLVMTVAADPLIRQVLLPDAAGGGGRVRLIQPGASGPEAIAAAPEPRLALLEPGLPLAPGDAMAYGALPGAGPQTMLAVGVPVPGLPWTVLGELDATTALAPLVRHRRAAAALAAAVAVALGLAFSVFWWRQRLARERAARWHLAAAPDPGILERTLRPALDAWSQMIAIKGLDGRYLYANRAFARALGRKPEELAGRADGDLLPPDAAHELGEACAKVAEGADLPPISLAAGHGEEKAGLTLSIERIESGGRTGGVLLLRAPDPGVRSQVDRLAGEAGERVAAALHQAMGLRDRFLLEQAGRLRTYAGAVGRRLGLDEREIAVLELAASLSQLGRIFLPDWLLARPGPWSPEETRMMRACFRDGLEVVRALGLQPAVVDVMAQMHERQDGTGQPEGLRGEEIGLPARVLGAIEAFCGLTGARGGLGMSPGQALYDLARKSGRFDVRVISVLAAVVAAESQRARAAASEGTGADARGGQVAAEAAA